MLHQDSREPYRILNWFFQKCNNSVLVRERCNKGDDLKDSVVVPIIVVALMFDVVVLSSMHMTVDDTYILPFIYYVRSWSHMLHGMARRPKTFPRRTTLPDHLTCNTLLGSINSWLWVMPWTALWATVTEVNNSGDTVASGGQQPLVGGSNGGGKTSGCRSQPTMMDLTILC